MSLVNDPTVTLQRVSRQMHSVLSEKFAAKSKRTTFLTINPMCTMLSDEATMRLSIRGHHRLTVDC